MLIKDKIIKDMLLRFPQEKNVLDAVIGHQFDGVVKALNEYKSVEVSGFGKFVFNDRRAQKYMDKFVMQAEYYREALANSVDEKDRHKNSLKLNTALLNIKNLKPKLNSNVTVE